MIWLLLALGLVGCGSIARVAPPPSLRFVEIGRFHADEAQQAVAVDSEFFYAIASTRIGKYRKANGEKVGSWRANPEGSIVHLNSGVVIDGVLYCAHSNYPHLPMRSSIERFDTATLSHIGSHDLATSDGSATWVDRKDGRWSVTLANYRGKGGLPGRGPESTLLRWFDQHWQPLFDNYFPSDVIARLGDHSVSGGSWSGDGRLYASGHDRGELYILAEPRSGDVLELQNIIPIANEGQGIAWDPTVPDRLYTVVRSRSLIVVFGSESDSRR